MVDPTPKTFDKQGGTVETAQVSWFMSPWLQEKAHGVQRKIGAFRLQAGLRS